jgi:O-antigen/teichoic acid export membrane protein
MSVAVGMTGLRRSLGIAFVTQYAELLVQFLGMLVLARIITSKDVGIYSVAAFGMAILHVFRDFGVGKYIIQEETLTPAKIRSAFGVAIILAWSVALLLLSSRSVIAEFYHEPAIKDILTVMAGSFAVTPVGSMLIALFRREMQLKKIAVVRITSAVCHTVVAVTMALMGYGALSLAWANFASILSFGIVAALLRSPETPLTPRFNNIRDILSFGSIASLGSVAGVAGANSPDVIIGKTISLAATGYYSRANGLVQMFKTVVAGVVAPLVLPYFAQLRRDKGDILRPYHLAVEQLTVFAWPFLAVMAVLALPLVRTLYGMNWDASVPVARILCLAAAISMLSTFAGDLMIAYGNVKEVTFAQLLTHPARVVAIIAASPFGLQAVGLAIVASEILSVVVTSYFLHRTTAISFTGVLRATLRSAVVTLCSVVGPVLTVLAWNTGRYEWLQTLIGSLGALTGWIVAIVLTDHPMKIHLDHARLWFLSTARLRQ